MFGIGETELAFIALFAFLVFGPDKLPGMGRTLGRVLRQFRSAQEGITQVVQTEIMDPAAQVMNADDSREARTSQVAPGETQVSATNKETFAERKARLARERELALAEAEAQEIHTTAADESVDAPAYSAPTAAELYASHASNNSAASISDTTATHGSENEKGEQSEA